MRPAKLLARRGEQPHQLGYCLTRPSFGRVFALWQLLRVAPGEAGGERFVVGSQGFAGFAAEMHAVRRGCVRR
ncbi:hypothethical protein (plasmid) [Ralstonia solanacearum CMR15]|nr:hypothethical protein [Ralstonia solanacearum CMR15]